MIKKIFKMLFLISLILFLLLLSYFFIGKPPRAKEIKWGVNFSQKHAQNFGMDWRENYTALLDEMGVKNIKLITHWDLIEPELGKFYFDDIDWQIDEAQKRGSRILLVVGMKTPRWPECHIPEWAKKLSKEEQQEKILNLVGKIVSRYSEKSGTNAIWGWQVENEPFFPFGECPWSDEKFLKKEINLVKSLDPVRDSEDKEKAQGEQISNGVDSQKRPIIISESGEGSLWFKVAKLGDIVGTTMYKKVWFGQLKTYLLYPFPPIFYWRKAEYIKKIFNKKVIVVELQAEPWGPVLLYDLPLREQEKTMNLEQFRKNIEFAKKTGFDEFYLWGSEWWYWLKVKHNKPEIWNEARRLFTEAQNQ